MVATSNVGVGAVFGWDGGDWLSAVAAARASDAAAMSNGFLPGAGLRTRCWVMAGLDLTDDLIIRRSGFVMAQIYFGC